MKFDDSLGGPFSMNIEPVLINHSRFYTVMFNTTSLKCGNFNLVFFFFFFWYIYVLLR